jgi:serine/threonine-protein kinase
MKDGTEVATDEGPTRSDGDREPAATPDPESIPKAQGERYKVLSRLGKGGMGEVMAVRDTTIGREVALKRIRKANPSDRLLERFMREAGIQGRLEHPAIVPLYDMGYDASGAPYFTMKKLAGTTLAKLLETDHTPFAQQRMLRAFSEVCLAVELAHVRGVIHRDLKPDNIVLGDFGEVYVLDWGVAKIVGEPDADLADITSGAEDSETGTMPGTVIGTPGFMSPEQVRGLVDVDARTDVYALGCILFQIMSRQMLHPAGKAALATALTGLDARPSVRTPERSIPPELDELCVLATALEREKRIATARELGERVQRYLDGDRDLATRKKLALEHLQLAQAAFAAGDGMEERRTAMREAASALALDPELTAAAELVGRLMLEPPRTTPPEVKAQMLEDDVVSLQGSARVGLFAYLGFLAFTPLIWLISPPGSMYVPIIAGVLLLNVGLCYAGTRVRPLGLESLLAVGNAILLALLAHWYSPFFVAPGLAAMSAMAFGFSPTRSQFTQTFGMILMPASAVLVPFVLERLDVLATTTSVTGDGILMRAQAIGGEETTVLVVAALYVFALVGSAAFMASRMKAQERRAKRDLFLQAWQLRQLVAR